MSLLTNLKVSEENVPCLHSKYIGYDGRSVNILHILTWGTILYNTPKLENWLSASSQIRVRLELGLTFGALVELYTFGVLLCENSNQNLLEILKFQLVSILFQFPYVYLENLKQMENFLWDQYNQQAN